MRLSTPYETIGRTHQKARTRRALVAAATDLLGRGIIPTVEQTADAASISRTTAYRYFPNQRALITATFPEMNVASLLPEKAPEDARSRLAVAAEALARLVVQHEPELRAQLRLSLQPDHSSETPPALPFRTGRALRWIEEALEPLRQSLSKQDFRRLVLAIRTTVGIEALVWLTDVAGLSREEAIELMSWSARALLRAGSDENSEPTAIG